jgi:hypothetical protein
MSHDLTVDELAVTLQRIPGQNAIRRRNSFFVILKWVDRPTAAIGMVMTRA